MIDLYSIFRSIQGESSLVGLPMIFVRLAGCPLFCSYCDTRYACDASGEKVTVAEIIRRVSNLSPHSPSFVTVTGGEPLFQNDTLSLLSSLVDNDFLVSLETSGYFSIKDVDPRVHVIMDIKCPSSNMDNGFCFDNLVVLSKKQHEIKFVISNKEDFDWLISFCSKNNLWGRVPILVSAVNGQLEQSTLAEWLLCSPFPMRFNCQLHRVLWPNSDKEC